MASKAQIGAVIGIEGADAFIKNMRDLAQYTKEFKSELNAVTSSFEEHNRTLSGVKSQRETLTKLIQNANDKLYEQQKALQAVNDAAGNAEVKDKDWIKVQSDLTTQINRTTSEINNYQKALDKLNEENGLTLFVDAWKNTSNKTGEALKDIGSAMTKYITAPIMAADIAAVKVYSDWDSAFAGVRKTVDEIVDENDNLILSYDMIEQAIKNMALTTSSSIEEIAAVYEVAGQLGQDSTLQQLNDFSETMIKLGDSTNMSATEAAEALARVLNITKEKKDIKKLGNSIVALGNNFATTESDIVAMTNRLAAGGTLAGLTTTEILGLATAMSSVGITAEAGGTAMTQTLTAIERQIQFFRSGAENNLGRIAEIAGMSAESFAKAWQEKPIDAVTAFITGLGSLDEKGESATLILEELGMSGIRQGNMLKSLALASKELTDAVEMSNDAYEKGNQLNEEAEKRYDTLDTKIGQLKESIKIFGTEVGETIAEVITPFIEKLTDLVVSLTEAWKNMPEGTKKAIVSIGGVVAAIGPLLLLAGNAIIWVSKLKGAFDILGGATGAGAAAKGIGKLIGTGGAATAGGTGLKGLIGSISGGTLAVGGLLGSLGLLIGHFVTNEEEARKFGEKLDETRKKAEELSGAVWDLGDPSGNGGMDGFISGLDEFGEPIITYTHQIKNEVQNASQETVKAVKEDLIDLKAGVKGNLTEMKDIINYNNAQIQTSMTESSLKVRNNTIAEYDAMSGEIILTSDRLKNNVPPKFKEMGDKINQQNQTTKQQFKMVLTGIEDEAKNVNLTTAGEHMMDTLRRGIENTAGKVINAAIGVAKGIKQYLEFSLPEKGPLSNFDKSMPDMMQLMAQGINDNSYLVEDAVSNLATNMSDRFNNQGQSYNYGGVVINLNVPQGADGRMIVDEIENELANRTIRRKAVFA